MYMVPCVMTEVDLSDEQLDQIGKTASEHANAEMQREPWSTSTHAVCDMCWTQYKAGTPELFEHDDDTQEKIVCSLMWDRLFSAAWDVEEERFRSTLSAKPALSVVRS